MSTLQIRLTLLTVGTSKTERTAAVIRVYVRMAMTAVLARSDDARMLAIVDVYARQRFFEQLHWLLVNDQLIEHVTALFFKRIFITTKHIISNITPFLSWNCTNLLNFERMKWNSGNATGDCSNFNVKSLLLLKHITEVKASIYILKIKCESWS